MLTDFFRYMTGLPPREKIVSVKPVGPDEINKMGDRELLEVLRKDQDANNRVLAVQRINPYLLIEFINDRNFEVQREIVRIIPEEHLGKMIWSGDRWVTQTVINRASKETLVGIVESISSREISRRVSEKFSDDEIHLLINARDISTRITVARRGKKELILPLLQDNNFYVVDDVINRLTKEEIRELFKLKDSTETLKLVLQGLDPLSFKSPQDLIYKVNLSEDSELTLCRECLEYSLYEDKTFYQRINPDKENNNCQECGKV